MKKAFAALALAIALPTIAHAQTAAPAQEKECCCEKMGMKMECCDKHGDKAKAGQDDHGGHDQHKQHQQPNR